MTDERFQELDKMIKGIASKVNYKLYSRDKEDIIQDLWVKALETEERKGKELDMNLLAKVLYDYTKDMIDYDQRRNHYNVDFNNDAEDAGQGDGEDFLGLSSKEDWVGDIMIDDLFNKYPEDSKERLFLDYWASSAGIRYNPKVTPPEGRENNGYTEGNLAKMLGFPSASSSSYRKFRSKMKQEIADFLGVDQ